MDHSEPKKTLKIRFRLLNGEEFEAEGPEEFIEAQRNYFLKFIHAQIPATPAAVSIAQLPQTGLSAFSKPLPNNKGNQMSLSSAALPSEIYFWERLFKEADNILLLRQKTKLNPQDLALLILAGAQTLLKKKTYSALELSKSFRLCGGPKGRLDRFLANELQSGRIIATGSKRSRTYNLSEEGFARAFLLAEKLLKS